MPFALIKIFSTTLNHAEHIKRKTPQVRKGPKTDAMTDSLFLPRIQNTDTDMENTK